MLHHSALSLMTVLATTYLLPSANAGFYYEWDDKPTRATFYGGSDAAGTMGGACGYGNLYNTGYGTTTAAASVALFNNGAICGACYEVECISRYEPARYCKVGARVTVTVTNLCPQGSEGGGCDAPQHHLDMAFPAWARIGTNAIAGVLETRMRRVPCRRSGGVAFTLTGNPWWIQVMVSNVAGPGDLSKLEISNDRGRSWQVVPRNWGSIYSTGGKFQGRSLSFRLTGGLFPQRISVIDAVPSNWYFGGTYQARGNFQTRAKRRRKTLEFFGGAEAQGGAVDEFGPWFFANATVGRIMKPDVSAAATASAAAAQHGTPRRVGGSRS